MMRLPRTWNAIQPESIRRHKLLETKSKKEFITKPCNTEDLLNSVWDHLPPFDQPG